MSEDTNVPEFMKSEEQKADENIFDPKNEIKAAWLKFNKIGDWFTGTLIGKREIKNTLPGDNFGKMIKVYDFKASGGSFHSLDGSKQLIETPVIVEAGQVWTLGGRIVIDNQMRNVKLGQKVGLKFTETKPAKQKGFNDLKIIKVYAGAQDPDWMGEDAVDMMPGIQRPGEEPGA